MWISQATWLKGQEELQRVTAAWLAAEKIVATQEATLGWFMHRLTQVEKERSKLIFNYTGVKVEAPEYEPTDPETEGTSMLQKNPLNALPTFNDMGEQQALKDGYGWDEEGNLTLHGQRI